MAKDKKAKKQQGKRGKKSKGLKSLANNPLLADVVAAALVATASALRDSKRARALASDAGDELGAMSEAGSEKGNILWEMAVQIGKRSLEALTSEPGKQPRKKSLAKAAPKAKRTVKAGT